jgi:hypothetical protein
MSLIDHNKIPWRLSNVSFLALCELIRAQNDAILLKRIQIASAHGIIETARFEDNGRQKKLVRQLLLPLFAEIRWQNDQQPAFSFSPLLSKEQSSLDGLTEPHLVSENSTLGKRTSKRKQRRFNLMRVQIDLSVR